MSNKVSILDNGPACEPDKFIVEVVGNQHPDTQKLVICDEVGKPLSAVTAAAADEAHDAADFASLLKVWNWDDMTGSSLSLEIASESGAPIRLPLLADRLRPTPRQEEAQLNQIVPIVPCTALPGIESSSDLGIPVVVRSGYIYVFYHSKLWRELEVRFTDTGTRFHDVDVASYRSGKGFKMGKRETSGVALEDIWLPSQWNGRPSLPVQMMFSEVQLSPARLAYMERHESRLGKRTRSPGLLISESSLQERWASGPDGLSMLEERSSSITRYRMDMFAFPVGLCVPQRQRQPGHEWLLDQPARYISDLSGEYMGQALASTRETVNTWRKGISNEPPREFESEAWHACQNSCDAETSAFWATQASEADILQSARQRKLHAVLLPDPMYRMRHLASRIGNLQALLQDCTRLAMEHPHHGSALLLHNLAVPSRIGNGPNPLSQSLRAKLNEDGKREINIATAAIERAHVRRLLESSQQMLAAALELGQYQQCIADHLSLDGFDYQAAMFSAVRLLASIATPAAQLDPLAFNGDIHDAVTGLQLHRAGRSSAQQLLASIANNNRHPLHVMLWPAIEEEQLFTVYQAPSTEEPNQGDGCFRATALACLEDQDTGGPDSETLDGITLAALMESGTLQDSFTVQLGARQGMAVLSRINEILHGAAQAAENRLTELANQAIDSRQTQTQQQTTANNARQNQAQHRNTLGAEARTVSIKLHGMQAEHLRQTMPRAFENAVFIRAGNVGKTNIRDYYLLGLEDLPEVDPNAAAARLYGEYRDSSGRLLATTNARSARRAGMPIVPESGSYFVIPANSRTATVLRKLNLAINEEALAGSALVATQSGSRQLNSSFQLATENLRRAREGLTYRALNSRPFSAMVLMVETWNVTAAVSEMNKVILERGRLRSDFGSVSASADLLLAIEVLAAKVTASQPLTAFAERALLQVPDDFAKKIFGTQLAKYVVRTVTVRILAVAFAGLLLAGLSLSDALHAALWSDNAVWGHYMVAAGGLLGVGAALLSGSVLLGVVGLVAVALIIGGTVLITLFSNNDFEDWLAGSIFNREGSPSGGISSAMNMMPFVGNSPRYLKDPDEAFYRLVGLLTGITILIESNPHHDPLARITVDSSSEELIRRANTRISVSSNIMGLATQLGTPDSLVNCCLARQEISITPTSGINHQSRKRLLPDQSTPLLRHITNNIVELYVNTPPNTRQSSRGYQLIDEYHWEVRAQLRLVDDARNKTWVFPAPSPKMRSVDPTKYSTPDFRKTDQMLWADQETHGVGGVRE